MFHDVLEMPPAHRPQTLKQAKRAYQRHGPARPSASEIAQAERREALQERADRIKDREARRKANLKKRNEKNAKERETAKETGKPSVEDQKPRWKVGASQLRLGGFLSGIRKIREPHHTKLVGESFSAEQTGAAEAVQPSANSHDTVKQPPINSTLQMPPPPIPIPQRQAVMLDESFEDCFPSNTQVQRELSPDVIGAHESLRSEVEMQAKLNLSGIAMTKQDDSDLLAQISTQDLDFADSSPTPTMETKFLDPEQLLAEISTQDLDFSQEVIEMKSANSESFTDIDLESFVMECGIDSFEPTLGI